MNVIFKGYKRKSHQIPYRTRRCFGMGIRVSRPTADFVPSDRYPRVKSARRFIKFSDSPKVMTFAYEVFKFYGYGCDKIECICREPMSILERNVHKLHWKAVQK